MQPTGLFITGTDTECGKTEVTLGLMCLLQRQGDRVAGMKPVASGAVATNRGLRNEDALRLQQQASLPLDYQLINPFAFEPPIAPHIAARQAGREIDFPSISRAYQALSDHADLTLVEGVGGWCVPLGEGSMLADLACALALPVVLVVGVRLGCINHALLTAQAIRNSGCALIGWVANRIDPSMLEVQQTLGAIEQRIGCPLFGVVPFLPGLEADQVADSLDRTAICSAGLESTCRRGQ